MPLPLSALAGFPLLALRRQAYRLPYLIALGGLLFLAAYSAILIVQPGETLLRIQSNIIFNIPPMAALGLVSIPIRRSAGRERIGWVCLAILLLTWQMGDWTFSYYDLLLGTEPPFPGFADVAYYAGYLAFIAAIPLLTFPERRLHDQRSVFDAAIVIIVAGAIAWEYVMKPIVAESGGAYFEATVALGYPLLDLVLLTTLVATLFASGGRFSARALVLTSAAAAQVVTDAVYTYAVTTVGYDNVGNPLELGWIAAYLLLAICFVLPSDARAQSSSARPSLVGLVLPYAAGLPLVALLIAGAVEGRPSMVLLSGAVAAVALVVARQFLTLRDNLSLLVQAANYDPLTGMANRRLFEEDAGRRLRRHRDTGGAALLLLGLDDLKAVNDSLGQRAGDEVITKVAQVLSEFFSSGARPARLGGDEFAVLLERAGAGEAEAVARRLLETLRQRPVVIEGHIIPITASAGIALRPEHGTTLGELLGHADLAMDEAKLAGGNDVRVYDPGRGGQALSESRLLWKRRIGEALEQDLFVLYAQPIVQLATRQTHEYEILLRLPDDEGQLMAPGAFLGVAERFGLIHGIDRWVLRQAIRLIATHQRQGSDIRLAVNLSGKAFEDGDLLHFAENELRSAAIDPGRLTLEVTETAAIADLDRAQKFIGSLKRLGCRFALDDFGVGFSSLHHLKHLPVDYLKIDGSFIRQLPYDAVDQQLVKGIVALARALGRQTIAEFVQDEETVRLLQEFGVEYGQGFYLGRPEPVSMLPAGDRLSARAA